MKNLETGFELDWSDNTRGGKVHQEWHAPCGCAYHPVPSPHVHPCAEHDTKHGRLLSLRSGATYLVAEADVELFKDRAKALEHSTFGTERWNEAHDAFYDQFRDCYAPSFKGLRIVMPKQQERT